MRRASSRSVGPKADETKGEVEPMNRRSFLKTTAAGVAAAGALGANAAPAKTSRPVAPSDRINVAVIGPGSRGQEDMRNMLRVPGVTFVGLADVWPQRFVECQKL